MPYEGWAVGRTLGPGIEGQEAAGWETWWWVTGQSSS